MYDLAVKAIRRMFSDVSVSKEETLKNLKSLIEEIELFIDALEMED